MLAPHEAYSVSSLLALREVNSLKTTMTKAQAEIVLGSFVAKGWLLKSRRDTCKYLACKKTNCSIDEAAIPSQRAHCWNFFHTLKAHIPRIVLNASYATRWAFKPPDFSSASDSSTSDRYPWRGLQHAELQGTFALPLL